MTRRKPRVEGIDVAAFGKQAGRNRSAKAESARDGGRYSVVRANDN